MTSTFDTDAVAAHLTEGLAPAPEPWQAPAALGGHKTLPEFPVDSLPQWVRDEVTGVAEFTQTPVDLAATIALTTLSAAAGGRVVVEVRGSWREPTNVFGVALMLPGSRKSAVFAELSGPLLDAEHHLIEDAVPRISELDVQLKVALKTAEKATQKAAADGTADALANAVDAAAMAEAITIPVLPRLVADDVTPEAAASLLAEQGGRLAVLSAEGGIFATLAGRYSSGAPNLEVFLKGHAGDMLRVDRKGRPPEHVPHPALTLGLAAQPSVLRDIAQMPGFRGRGLLARIFYSLPANMVGYRKIGAAAVDEDVRKTYADNIKTLVLSLNEWTDPAVLTLTEDAGKVVLAAEAAIEPRLRETGDLGHIADWGSKLVGGIVRIAALLHLATHVKDGWGKSIEASTLRDALRIGEYFTAHALAAFDEMGTDSDLEDARVLADWLIRTKPVEFTIRDMFTGVSRARFKKVTDLDAGLAILESHGYIRRQGEPERTGPGRRPSPRYDVNPYVAAETAERQ